MLLKAEQHIQQANDQYNDIINKSAEEEQITISDI